MAQTREKLKVLNMPVSSMICKTNNIYSMRGETVIYESIEGKELDRLSGVYVQPWYSKWWDKITYGWFLVTS